MKKLAEKAGLSASYLCQLENNAKCNPGCSIVARLAAALGVTFDQLVISQDSGSRVENDVRVVAQLLRSMPPEMRRTAVAAISAIAGASSEGKGKMKTRKPDYEVEVCDACGTASCWQGDLMCEQAKHGGLSVRLASDLDGLALESRGNYSERRLMEVFGRVEYVEG